MRCKVLSKFLLTTWIFSLAQVSWAIEIKTRGEMIASNLLYYPHTVYLTLEQRTVLDADSMQTLFRYQASLIESYRGDFPQNFCFTVSTESPNHAPQSGANMIVSFFERTDGQACFATEAAATSSENESYLKILRAIRDAD